MTKMKAAVEMDPTSKEPKIDFVIFSAASRSSLKLHVRKHTGEKPYSCDLCDYKTGDHNSLRRHKMRHSGIFFRETKMSTFLYSKLPHRGCIFNQAGYKLAPC